MKGMYLISHLNRLDIDVVKDRVEGVDEMSSIIDF